jgi:excisionase family DNA binding protein
MMQLMTTKPTSPSSRKRNNAGALGRAPATLTQTPRLLPMFELSFDVSPVVSVIRRHVKLSKEADEAIRRDLVDVLNHAVVQLRLTEQQAPACKDDQVLSTEKAAQLAGVSRPYMAKLIDAGVIELHQKVGNQRRVLRSAVIRWQTTERAQQAKALKRLAEDLDEEIFSS